MLVLLLALSLGPTVVDLLPAAGCRPAPGLPPEWSIKPVAGVAAPEFSTSCGQGSTVLRASGEGTAAWAVRQLDSPLKENGELHWWWRVLDSPTSADLSTPAGDDSPLRVYVLFGRTFFNRPAHAIFYTWAETGTSSVPHLSFVSDQVGVVPLPAQGSGEWSSHHVDPFEDFGRFWSGTPPPIRAIGVMQDTDATGELATGEIRSLSWHRHASQPPPVSSRDRLPSK